MSADKDVEGHAQKRPVMNRLGERIRLTEMNRRGELAQDEYRRRLKALDSAT